MQSTRTSSFTPLLAFGDSAINPRWQGQHLGLSPQPTPVLRTWGPWLAAGLIFGILLCSFSTVVQGNASRAQRQQLVAEDRARAETRCESEPVRGLRHACLAALSADIAVAALR